MPFVRRGLAVALVIALWFPGTPLHAQAPAHPLDGLSAAEHWVVWDVLKAAGKVDSATKFAYEGLHETPKAEVLAWRPGMECRRAATVHLIQDGKKGFDAVIDIKARQNDLWHSES